MNMIGSQSNNAMSPSLTEMSEKVKAAGFSDDGGDRRVQSPQHHVEQPPTSFTSDCSCSRSSRSCHGVIFSQPAYTREHLRVFDVLDAPVFVFDIKNERMFYANPEAIKNVWGAENLNDLLARDYSSDMTDATRQRLKDRLKRFERGEKIDEQWTLYPKKVAKTIYIKGKGIHIKQENGESICMDFCEASYFPEPSKGVDAEHSSVESTSVRAVEALRHLPVSVAQFNLDGSILFRNSEDLKEFSNQDNSDDSDASEVSSEALSPLHERFVSQEIAEKLCEEVKKGKDVDIELQQRVRGGQLLGSNHKEAPWYAIKLRLVKDPVTSKDVILYIAQNITDRVLAKREKSEADRANTAKSEFLAVMGRYLQMNILHYRISIAYTYFSPIIAIPRTIFIAHELRTPLHQVIGWIDLLGQTQLNDEQGEFLSLMEASALHFMAIINDMLDFTKFEAGALELESIPFEPHSVLEGSLAAINGGAQSKNIKLSSDINCCLGQVAVGDPNRFRQILLNLLSNALKFTDNGGSISLNAKQICECTNTSKLRFEVIDTGIGISAEDQKRLFTKFQQADASVSRNYGGTGLGLAICKKLCTALGGDIGVISQLGTGTTFWFELEFQLVQQGNDPGTGSSRKEVPAVVRAEEGESSLHVLVVEDNIVNQKVVCSMLRRIGHKYTICENGKVAVDLVTSKNEAFDVILMDVQMPVMDGLEATRLIRQAGLTLPILGLTAEIRAMEKDVGMNDCLSKPIRLPDLKQALSSAVKGDT